MGNVAIGHDIPLSSLKPHYDALLFAYGASQDRLLGVPGEHLSGIHSAREFVGWYNGLPDFAALDPDLESTDHAVVIGNGNVALDVARILLSEIDVLRKTDVSEHALEGLGRSRVRRVTIVGRRGPMQAAFTIKEIRELTNLPSTLFYVHEHERLLPSSDYISQLPRLEQRKYRLPRLLSESSLRDSSRRSDERMPGKACEFQFLLSPESFIPSRRRPISLASVRLARNVYSNESEVLDPTARVRRAESDNNGPAMKDLETALAFRSIGYKAVALPGLTEQLNVGFDGSRGTITNDGFGRCLSPHTSENLTAERFGENLVPGCYCTGWVKNGPTGVIASTMEDAFATADAVVTDWESSGHAMLNPKDDCHESHGWNGLRQELSHRTDQIVSWRGWKAIDQVEKERGRREERVRVKITSVPRMLNIAAGGEAPSA